MEASLAVAQPGMTLFGAAAAATGGAVVQERIAPWSQLQMGLSPGWARAVAIVLAVLPLTFVGVTFGDLAPKVFALRNKEWVCLKLSPLMQWLSVAGRPAV